MVIVDSNVLIDVLDDDPKWADWSQTQLDRLRPRRLCINPAIYAEIAPQFARVQDVDSFLAGAALGFEPFTHEQLFIAGKTHRRYRASGGERKRVLADFMIGAQAAVDQGAILTRDPKLFRTYFPTIELITP